MRSKTVFCLLASALLAAFTFNAQAEVTLKGSHQKMNIPCDTCHGPERPRQIPEEEACMQCHISRDAVKAKTAHLNPNPHYGHDESISCNDCHKQHEPSVLVCDQCHKFGYKTP